MRIPKPIGITFGGFEPGKTPTVDVRFEIADLDNIEYRDFVEKLFAGMNMNATRPKCFENSEDGS